METVQFKTNIKCSGCIATVTPVLNEVAGKDNWEVDLQSPDKLLTVATDKASKEEIRQAVKKAGYEAEALS
ncbi:heavy-metal-associated domain-containing protein [Chitinophaga tropicalis]|uniref:Heavy metal transport/detoxification protein n=1 Tax=Chitinophaga tropicalis TaxID=2683588 RepID=A0A7K1U0L4_9BACT|nr:heavy-metal-associated domain-containing protein [Chitinophaga tropicalis]MVT07908.1 heavy metal transport/detoxification protein [Chitinophaga tropicalis]